MPFRFSYDAMLNFNGDTAVYLLYGHARIASILKKAETSKGISIEELKQRHSIEVDIPHRQVQKRNTICR